MRFTKCKKHTLQIGLIPDKNQAVIYLFQRPVFCYLSLSFFVGKILFTTFYVPVDYNDFLTYKHAASSK